MALPISVPILLKDKLFCLAIVAGPFFWLSLYFSGTGITGIQWLKSNIWIFIQLGILLPVLEEIVFRGLLQETLWKTRVRRLSVFCLSMPNIITAILFTAFHFINHSPVWAVAVLGPALVFGFFRDRYRHVAPAIVLHVFYNSGYFILFGS